MEKLLVNGFLTTKGTKKNKRHKAKWWVLGKGMP